MKTLTHKGSCIAVVTDEIIKTPADALDMMGSAYYDGCVGVMVPKDAFSDDFYNLRTGLAGEILQKFSTYGMRLAIVGDFSNIQSKALRDFIYESNKGRQVFFVETQEDALDRLAGA